MKSYQLLVAMSAIALLSTASAAYAAGLTDQDKQALQQMEQAFASATPPKTVDDCGQFTNDHAKAECVERVTGSPVYSYRASGGEKTGGAQTGAIRYCSAQGKQAQFLSANDDQWRITYYCK